MAAPEVVLYVSPFPQEGTERSRRLLRQVLRHHAGDAAEDPLVFGPFGKPQLPACPGLHFSVTHSGGFWMCAVSGTPVGLDLQIFQDCDRARLSRRFFHPDEDAFLRRREYADFFALWAAKESYLKYTGQGITQELSACSVVSPEGAFPSAPGAALRLLPWRREYALCLCTPALCAVRFQTL